MLTDIAIHRQGVPSFKIDRLSDFITFDVMLSDTRINIFLKPEDKKDLLTALKKMITNDE